MMTVKYCWYLMVTPYKKLNALVRDNGVVMLDFLHLEPTNFSLLMFQTSVYFLRSRSRYVALQQVWLNITQSRVTEIFEDIWESSDDIKHNQWIYQNWHMLFESLCFSKQQFCSNCT